ncbi:MAG: tripartite tricarboxylate transporter receptor family protein [Ramlibacter sp.]|jgi:tripartite-type tricarboxylate transporter receptor subunit TctC|nr:tripartite tricarboxylate transporter receptor family protein [Ramlibacter sp.]
MNRTNRGRRLLLSAGIAAVAAPLALPAFAQAFPSRPLRLVVPFPAGGIVDVTARQLGQKLSESLGQPVVVDNRAGAGGSVGTDFVAKSAPDGYALLMAFDTHAVNPHIYKSNLRYDTFKDLVPVSAVGSIPLLFAAPPSLPANTIAELVQLAKSKPGALSYGSVGAGSSGHLAAEQFKLLSGTSMVHVPFKGGAPALQAILGEQIQLLVFAAGAAVPLVRSGKVKALAVAGTRRSAALPNVPTMAESGYPQLNAGAWMGIVAPAGTPAPIVAQLNAAIAKALKDPVMSASLADQAVELASSSPAEFGTFIRAEHEKWGKLIADAKLDLSQ